MNRYQETLDYLYGQLPMYQRSGAVAYKNTLGTTLLLDKLLGHPHHEFKTIHVAGTNGKGSASHMLASVLQEAGYKTGLYTSPHLIDFRERIRINGEMITEEAVVEFMDQFRAQNQTAQLEPSFFEITVSMAFDYFRNQKVDVAVIEVGMGGRLDSTNIITPEVSLITNISLDHTAILGNTVAEIAKEKAGIIKSGVSVVISESNKKYNSIFEQISNDKKSQIFFADRDYQATYSLMLPDGKQLFNFHKNKRLVFPDLKIDMVGNYQKLNLIGVLKIIEILQERGWKLKRDHIYQGLSKTTKNTGIRGRWEIVGNNPMVVCDTAHNESGIKMAVEQIRNTAWKSLHIILGMVNDKDISPILKLLPSEADYYFTQANIPRALDAQILKEMAETAGLKGSIIRDVKTAAKEVIKNAGSSDLIFIGGSTFVVADYFS